MAANLPVAFGALLAGGLLLEHGISTAKGAFTSSGSTAAGTGTVTTGKITTTNLGPTTNPVPGASPGRLDMGVDGTTSSFVAPFNGKVVFSDPHDSGWAGGGYVAIAADANPNFVVYLAEGLTPTVNQGDHVTVGQQVATPRANPYNGIVGNFETGRANPAVPRQPLALATTDPKTMVLDFYHWLQGLGGAATSNPSNAGYP